MRTHRFDIKAIGVDDPGVSDEEVMQIAISESRTIVTYDSDYSELIFKHGYKPQAGVIYIRIQPESPTETAKVIEKLINASNLCFQRTLTVFDANGVRQRKY